MICVEVHSNNVLALRSDTLSNAVSDSIKHETIKFLFPDNWNNYQKTAVFSAVGVEPINVLLCEENQLCLSKDECYIPFEVLKGDCFEVSVFGVLDETLATTTKEQIEVLQSGYTLGDQPSEPTQSEYSQILQMVIDTKQIAQSVRDDANNGVFKGEKGEKGDKGEEYSLTDTDKAEIVQEVESKIENLETDVETIKQGYVTLDYIENKYPDAQTVDRRIAEYDLTVQETYATKQYVDDAVTSGGVSQDYVDNAIGALEDDVAYLSTHAATKQYVDDAVASVSGGVSSWNDLTDKPFYEGFITTILDYSNLPTVSGVLPTGSVVYKVTDDILTSEQLDGSVITVEVTNTDGNMHNDTLTLSPLSAVHSVQLPLGTIYYDGMLIESLGKEVTFFISVAEQEGTFDFNGTSFTVPETGTYLGLTTHNGETQNSMSLEYNGIKTLDIKFIPDSLYTEIDQRIENYINEALGGDY